MLSCGDVEMESYDTTTKIEGYMLDGFERKRLL